MADSGFQVFLRAASGHAPAYRTGA